MMYYPGIDDTLRITVFCVAGEQVSNNVFYKRVTATTGESLELNELASLAANAYSFLWTPMMSVYSAFYGVKVELVVPIAIPQWGFFALNVVGDANQPLLPRQSAGIVTWRTSLVGKRYRGRTYFPFPSTLHCESDGTPTPGYKVLLEDVIDVFAQNEVLTGAGGSVTWRTSVYSRINQGSYPVQSGTARDKFATQRRRGSYGKANSLPG